MRIAVGSLSHESNSFNPKLMTLKDFNPVYGNDVIKKLDEGGQNPLQGIRKVVSSYGAEIIPTIFARAIPGGLVSRAAYEEMKQGFLYEVRQAGQLDGICLHLHGSMTVEEIGDAEGDILTELRQIVGEEIPIVVSLDMHATITPAMLQTANAFVGYRTAPHVDTMQTGERAAKVLMESLTKGYKLSTVGVGLPLLVSGEMSESAKPPMNGLIERLSELEENPDIASASIFLGFPWVDVSFNQGMVMVVTKDNPELAEEEAKQLAIEFWSKLHEFKFTTEAYPFEEALEVALRQPKGPVCLADCGDNPGAGGSQNIVYPLKVMLERNLESVLFGAIADEAAYEYCAAQEIGSTFDLSFGKLSIAPDAPALQAKATLKCVGRLGERPAVAVQVGGIDVMISQDRIMMLDPKDVEQLGLDPLEYRLIVIKSGYLDPKYEEIASYGLLALTPGFTNQIFTELEYKHVKRPIYPLDLDFAYTPNNYLMRGR